MRAFYYIVFILINLSESLFAQKKPLDFSTPESWPIIESPAISNNGKYISYTIAIHSKGNNYIVQAIDHSWKKEIAGIVNASFTADSRILIFRNLGDSLGIEELGTENIRYITNVEDFRIPQEGNGQWLFYQKKDPGKTLVVRNLFNSEEKTYTGITEYLINESGSALVMKVETKTDSLSGTDLKWLNTASEKLATICRNCRTSQLVLDKTGAGLAFFKNEALNNTELEYYKEGMDSARDVAGYSTPGMVGMKIKQEAPEFSQKGNKLFFYIEKPDSSDNIKLADPSVKVTIQGMYDEVFQSEQAKKGPFLACVDLETTGNIIRLQQEKDNQRQAMDNNGNWLVTESNIFGSYNDYKWRESARPDVYLVSTKDGQRRLLEKRLIHYDLSFSVTGKYVIWFDRKQKHWFSHNTDLNITKNITSKINTPVYSENDRPDFPLDEGIAGWLENDEAVLIYDRYDIWKVDPEGIRPPVNLTGGYGARNKIRMRYMDFSKNHSTFIHPQDTLILSAFDMATKDNGFYRLTMGNKVLQKLTISRHSYSFPLFEPSFCGALFPGPVLKARDANAYIVARMSATEYPNLYFTSDFRDFKALTDLAPQKNFNWYTTELVHWKQFDGRMAEGILYKPENFDPRKQYPIIFYYYEKNAFALNIFIHPELSNGQMNIPWFVSNGYIVFVPDIYYKTGYPGKSAYNSVVSAAIYLSNKSWINRHKMGLQGHSFGGFETNYIVSHSSLFTAAAPASSVSNEIDLYGELECGTWFYERTQGRIGATLWQKPDLYIENSSVFKADKVKAAILIMHGKNDATVPYSQGVQWYNELHRLGKKAWLLSYTQETHGIDNPKNKLDYSIRLSQFFNHYLQDKPEPTWMTGNIQEDKEPK